MWSKPASRTSVDDAMETYYQDLCAAARRRGHNASSAHEIVHDLYLRLAGKPRLPESGAHLKPFLVRACINLGIDRFRRERLERRLFCGNEQEALTVAQDSVDADALADRHHRLAVLHTAIMEMSLQRRRVFLASCVSNLGSGEIAVRTGITRNMVDRHLRKAYFHCLSKLDETL